MLQQRVLVEMIYFSCYQNITPSNIYWSLVHTVWIEWYCEHRETYKRTHINLIMTLNVYNVLIQTLNQSVSDHNYYVKPMANQQDTYGQSSTYMDGCIRHTIRAVCSRGYKWGCGIQYLQKSYLYITNHNLKQFFHL